jgi:hypothetical protein
MPNTMKLHVANLLDIPANTNSRYIRAGGLSGARIRYHRIGVGRPARCLKAKVQAKIARLAYMVCALAPNVADQILELPSWRVGRMVKTALRRTRKTARKRRFCRCRPASGVLRILVDRP